MSEILQLSLEVLNQEVMTFGLEVNWSKTKAQFVGDSPNIPATIAVSISHVDVVESFIYLGSMMHNSGSCELEALPRH